MEEEPVEEPVEESVEEQEPAAEGAALLEEPVEAEPVLRVSC
jgi:hypothetical protein